MLLNIYGNDSFCMYIDLIMLLFRFKTNYYAPVANTVRWLDNSHHMTPRYISIPPVDNLAHYLLCR